MYHANQEKQSMVFLRTNQLKNLKKYHKDAHFTKWFPYQASKVSYEDCSWRFPEKLIKITDSNPLKPLFLQDWKDAHKKGCSTCICHRIELFH